MQELRTDHAEAREAWRAADARLARGELRRAASALDVAFGRAPRDAGLSRARGLLLDTLSIEERGIRWRYIPAGTFLMGSESGDPDERPVHPESTGEYWMAETPTTWAAFCEWMGWLPPPAGHPREPAATPPGEPWTEEDHARFAVLQANKIRLQYCETETTAAGDWHAHAHTQWTDESGNLVSSEALFGTPPRANPDRPYRYDRKPVIAVGWEEADLVGRRMSTPAVTYRLPTEAEWEKAARGGLVGCRYAWGDTPPDPSRCDFGHFGAFYIRDPLTLPPNGYGLHGMCGTVWEWTADGYDALAYRRAAPPPVPHEVRSRVLRGGSWADCAAACTVSFRMSRPGRAWRGDCPNIGFRLVRVEHAAAAAPG